MNTKPCRKCGSIDRLPARRGNKFGDCRNCNKIACIRRYWENPESYRLNHNEWLKKNPTYSATYDRQRRLVDLQFHLTKNLRTRFNSALKNNFKSGSSVLDLGCSIPELKSHLESLWLPGMDWASWEPKGWHIDHIIPLSRFDLTDREQFLIACHYTNLQPLWAEDNLSKGNR